MPLRRPCPDEPGLATHAVEHGIVACEGTGVEAAARHRQRCAPFTTTIGLWAASGAIRSNISRPSSTDSMYTSDTAVSGSSVKYST